MVVFTVGLFIVALSKLLHIMDCLIVSGNVMVMVMVIMIIIHVVGKR